MCCNSMGCFGPKSFAWYCSLLVLAISSASVAVAGDDAAGAPSDSVALATPTHHQTGLITANVDGLPNRDLKCFCLTPDNRIVAGCAGGAGELRVFDDAGEYLESWSVPFEPEAIYVRGDGAIFLAGEGQLARLSNRGDVELQQPAPHVAVMTEKLDTIREEVLAQNKRRTEMYSSQVQQFDQLLGSVDKQIEELKQQLAALDESATANAEGEVDATNAPVAAAETSGRKRILARQLEMQERVKQQYEQTKEQFAEMIKRDKPKELTPEEIDKQVQAAIKHKSTVSSISATENEVFLATPAAVGYGFEVWKMDGELAGGKQIISGLSGCCGQMDVKVNKHGLFVAENSRHRVCRYGSDGELICKWGHGARKGLEGFGSCCNPMNVAFGPDDVVYTAEDNTGRIKRYSPDGELLGLVGSTALVPGCKNVSIAVNSDGSRVYMLDITRGHIVRMEPYKPGEAPVPATVAEEPAEADAESDAGTASNEVPSREVPSPGGMVAKGMLKLLGYGD